METTFGRTVETRLLTSYQLDKLSNQIKSKRLINYSYPNQQEQQLAAENIFNLNLSPDQKQLQINLLKHQKQKLTEKYQNELFNLRLKANKHRIQQQQHQQYQKQQYFQQQHELLNQQYYTHKNTQPKQQQQQQPCSSSILIRKSYKHLMNNNNVSQNSTGGYASDSECCSQKFNQINNSKNQTIKQTNFDFNKSQTQYQTDIEDDDIRSCVSMRTRLEMNQNEDLKYNRYKSLDRQNIRCFKQFNNNDTLTNTNQSRRYQPEKSNHTNSFMTHSYEPNVYYTPKLTHKYTKNSETINLTDYLTWKNFNCNPANSILTQKVSIEPNDKENCEFYIKNYVLNEATIRKNRSVSTPGTPLLSNLKRSTGFNKELKVDTSTDILNDLADDLSNIIDPKQDKYELITQKQKEIELQLKNIENLKQKKIILNQARSNSMNRALLKKPSELNLNKSQMEVMSLENALQNMNEILKKLTLNAQKRDDELVDIKTDIKPSSPLSDKQDLSPPLSTSTSISFSASISNEQTKKTTDILNECINENSSTNISPTSLSSSSTSNYSNTSIDLKYQSSETSSFSPSASTSSCSTNSALSDSSISNLRANSEIKDNSFNKLESSIDKKEANNNNNNNNNNKKGESISFRKRLKNFLFSNGSSKRN